MAGVFTALLTAVCSRATSRLPVGSNVETPSAQCRQAELVDWLAFVTVAEVVFRTNTREDFFSPSDSLLGCATGATAAVAGGGGVEA